VGRKLIFSSNLRELLSGRRRRRAAAAELIYYVFVEREREREREGQKEKMLSQQKYGSQDVLRDLSRCDRMMSAV
jgi:hypothetical protein